MKITPQPLLEKEADHQKIENDLSEYASDVLTLPLVTVDGLSLFVNTNEILVYGYFFRKLRRAIELDLDEVILLRFQTSNLFLKIKKPDYEDTLNLLMNSFRNHEEYEQAVNCRNVINTFYINKIIETSKE